MESLIYILPIVFLSIILTILLFKAVKQRDQLRKKVVELELKIKSGIKIKEFPEYIKHYDNHYKFVYKIVDLRILPQNPVYAPEMCAIITGKAKNDATLNATIDKFIVATKSEYENNLRDELKF
jgi:hypothetical protein